tara:strand:+ start:672 stop:1292 length:621 start_codon:yes stop_codon:yes gene_type:complete
MLEKLKFVIDQMDEQLVNIERQSLLKPLIHYIESKLINKKQVNLNFICTHNSRRSHLAQVWAQTIAHYFNFNNVFCYSGGTETTATHVAVLNALMHSGFEIEKISENENPVYNIKYSLHQVPVVCFSKYFDHSLNPSTDFAAILTCTEADKGCPHIYGADIRITMPFEDPKSYDNTSQQENKYLERSLQIATEMKYIFSKIKSKYK